MSGLGHMCECSGDVVQLDVQVVAGVGPSEAQQVLLEFGGSFVGCLRVVEERLSLRLAARFVGVATGSTSDASIVLQSGSKVSENPGLLT